MPFRSSPSVRVQAGVLFTVAFAWLFSALPSSTAPATIAKPDQKTLVVLVQAEDCKVCAQVRPLIDELEREYKGKVDFVRLDVTNSKTTKASRKTARQLGVGLFLSFYEDSFPAVGVFGVPRKKCLKELFGINTKDTYKTAIENALASSGTCSK